MCKDNLNSLGKIFNSTSKNLKENEKFFKFVELNITNGNKNQNILGDNLFADITFHTLYIDCPADYSIRIKKISNKVLGNSAKSLTRFWCLYCGLEHSPPDYDLWKLFSSMNKLEALAVGLDVDEIPSNAFRSIDGSHSILQSLIYSSDRPLTVKTGAIENLANLLSINIGRTKIKKFEKESFKLNANASAHFEDLRIFFTELNLTGDVFENGTFDGIKKNATTLIMQQTKINYLAEGVFKSFLENKKNMIHFSRFFDSEIDCEDCRNYWLIIDRKLRQVDNPLCKQNNTLNLFSPEIQTKLKLKCK